jgi:hypothetical protein
VTGEQGRDAVAVAEQILGRIRAHAWDDQSSGPIGPLAAPPLAAFPSVSVPDLPSSLPPVESG